MRRAAHPYLLIDVMSGPDRPLFVLLLGMENWDFLPPTATLLDLDAAMEVAPSSVRGVADMAGVDHVASTPGRPGVWFCSPGFYEYHENYPDDRWEYVRRTGRGRITSIIEQACQLVDRYGAAGGQ